MGLGGPVRCPAWGFGIGQLPQALRGRRRPLRRNPGRPRHPSHHTRRRRQGGRRLGHLPNNVRGRRDAPRPLVPVDSGTSCQASNSCRALATNGSHRRWEVARLLWEQTQPRAQAPVSRHQPGRHACSPPTRTTGAFISLSHGRVHLYSNAHTLNGEPSLCGLALGLYCLPCWCPPTADASAASAKFAASRGMLRIVELSEKLVVQRLPSDLGFDLLDLL